MVKKEEKVNYFAFVILGLLVVACTYFGCALFYKVMTHDKNIPLTENSECILKISSVDDGNFSMVLFNFFDESECMFLEQNCEVVSYCDWDKDFLVLNIGNNSQKTIGFCNCNPDTVVK